MKNVIADLFILPNFLIIVGLWTGCGRPHQDNILSPDASLEAMEVESGFVVEIVASEPLVIAPVALTFDGQGRIWVAEMDGYMPDTLGTGEDAPVGRIVILTDEDQDGRMDRREVFLDSLVLPRALCLVGGGLLVAEPPNLWFYEIIDGKPGPRQLVDSTYAEGGNVEHQPNGLLRGLDNWIYSAKYDHRYRRHPDGSWLKARTHFRGQWGISHDDWGRLYYNDNSNNLYGDYFPPGLGAGNPDIRGMAGYGATIVGDRRVYPIHATTGVNRGYMEGVLDSTGRLVNFTAACGPLVYRGGLIPGLNAFVAEPSANLIKRNILDTHGYRVTGRQAYEGREFLASRDERFRPVNLYDGPDGSLYIVDMYRGIIQHNTYLTPYLKQEIAQRNLSVPLGMGRIYRVFPKDGGRKFVSMPQSIDSLIGLLSHQNGWVRDQAQRSLIDRRDTAAARSLRRILAQGTHPMQLVHALWTLEGLDQLTLDDVRQLLGRPQWELRAQAITALATLQGRELLPRLLQTLKSHVSPADTVLAPYVALTLAAFASTDRLSVLPFMELWAVTHADDRFVTDAVISGLAGVEESFAAQVALRVPDTTKVLRRRLSAILEDHSHRAGTKNAERLAQQYPAGVALFQSACQPCHGEDGRGVQAIAPPLAGSEWVTGKKEQLIAVVLYGLTGPVEVAGHTYKAPEVSGEMPGIVHNTAIDTEGLAQLLNYIRRAWGNDGKDEVIPEDIGMVRTTFANRTEPFTQEELRRIYGNN